MKKIWQSIVILMIMLFGINYVKAEEIGVYCEYGNSWFKVSSESLDSNIKCEADSEEHTKVLKNKIFGDYNVGIELTLKLSDILPKLERIGFIVDSGNNKKLWNCPDGSFFGEDVSSITSKRYLGNVLINNSDSDSNTVKKDTELEKNEQKSGTSYTTVSCGWTDDIPAALPILFKNVINVVKISVPIILIIMGMLDFGKAVTSQDEKGMKESQTRFVKRIIGAVCVFLVITIVQFVFRLINVDDSNNILACIDCFVNNDCHKYTVVEAACYQCSSDTDKYIWSTNPGTTSACSGGYVKVDLSEKECKGKYIEKKCYQCNSNSNIYKWDSDSSADSACPSGYHERSDISAQSACHS